MPHDLYWKLTPRETVSLIKQLAARKKAEHRAAILYSGIVAAAVINSNPYRKRGARAVQPADFLPRETVIVSPEEAKKRFVAWAAALKGAQPDGLSKEQRRMLRRTA